MDVRAIAKYVRISPLKVHFICKEIRGKQVDEAMAILQFTPKKGARILSDVLKSAVANAEQNYGLEVDELYVKRIFADDGPRHRLAPYGGRFGSRGRFKPIVRRSSHITVILSEREVTEYK